MTRTAEPRGEKVKYREWHAEVMQNRREVGATLFSIGHSNHSMETFASLLKQHRIEVLIDVRSSPNSKYAPHFDAARLETALTELGFKYLSLGGKLGGRPWGDEFYDEKGRVLYSRVAESPIFLDGIRNLEKLSKTNRIAILCSEEDPSGCHRRLLIGRALTSRGIAISHIRGDGNLQSETALIKAEICQNPAHTQTTLTPSLDMVVPWKSTRSVLPKKRRPSFSGRLGPRT